MKLRLLLLLSLLQWSFSCFSVQAITTPVVYYGKVLSGGKGIANVPVTDGTQIVLTDDKDDIPYQVPLMQIHLHHPS